MMELFDIAMAKKLGGGGGSVNMSKYMENVGGDTLTWDGNTYGVENVNGMVYLISDVIPSIDDLKQGGTFKHNDWSLWGFSQESIIDVETMGLGHGVTFIMGQAMESGVGGSTPGFCVVHESGATANYIVGDTVIPFTFEKTGVYFVRPSEETWTLEVTINNYTGFGKEAIKKKYLPEEIVDDTLIVRPHFTTSGSYGGYTDGHRFFGFEEIIQAYDEGKTIKAIMPAFESRDAETGEQIGELELPLIGIPDSREYVLFAAINPYYGWNYWTDASYVMLKIESDGGFSIEEKPLMTQGTNEMKAETWTFTLEDGSTVTKKVVLA